MATVVKRFAIQGIEGYNVDIETKTVTNGQEVKQNGITRYYY